MTTPSEPGVGQLISQLSEQTSRLVRDELRLAQAELSAKGKKAGLGAGLFGGAGVFTLYGIGALVAAAILALAGPLSGWLAALIVAAGLFVVAAVGALIGKNELQQAVPPIPTDTVESVRKDVHAVTPGSER